MKSVSAVAHVSYSVLDRLLRGMILRTRRSTEAKILAVKLTEDRLVGREIPPGPTLRMIEALVAVGYRRGWIAVQCGAKTPALQIRRDRILASTAESVRALYERVTRPVSEPVVAAVQPASPSAKQRLAAALAGWDADEFSRRLGRLADVGRSPGPVVAAPRGGGAA